MGKTQATISNATRIIPFQGTLTNSSGNYVADGNYSITFAIYTVASGGTAAWSETQTVAVTNGAFSVNIGANDANGVNLALDTPPYYLGIKVGTNAEMTPRIQMGFSPFAMTAKNMSNIYEVGGNVGIGTTGPGKVLDILHASENELFRVRRGSGVSYQSASFGVDILGANYGAAIWHGTDTGTTQQATFYDTGLVLGSYVAAGNNPPTGGAIMSGNVGIGTTTPGSSISEKLTVIGSASIQPATVNGNSVLDMRVDGTGDPQIYFDLAGATPFSIGVDNSDGDKFKISANYQLGTNDRLVIDSSGNVGIGTTGPAAKLDINAASGAAFGAYDLAGVNKAYIGVSDGGGYINTDASGDIVMRAISGRILFGAGASPNAAINTSGDIGLGGTLTNSTTFAGASVVIKSGNVGIGTTNPSTALQVVGTITGTTKNFEIAHPTKPGMKLIHSTVEGPEVAVFYRGEAQLTNGQATVTLPEYFEALTRKEGRTVQLTAKNGWSPLYVDGEVVNGQFTVKADSGNPSQQFFWEVKAVRADIEPLVVEKSVN